MLRKLFTSRIITKNDAIQIFSKINMRLQNDGSHLLTRGTIYHLYTYDLVYDLPKDDCVYERLINEKNYMIQYNKFDNGDVKETYDLALYNLYLHYVKLTSYYNTNDNQEYKDAIMNLSKYETIIKRNDGTWYNKYKHLYTNEIETWRKMHSELCNFMLKHRRLPTYNENTYLYLWMISQMSDYKQRINVISNDDLYYKWEYMINHVQYRDLFPTNNVWKQSVLVFI